MDPFGATETTEMNHIGLVFNKVARLGKLEREMVFPFYDKSSCIYDS